MQSNIRIADLSVELGSKLILDSISLECARGEFVTIVGKNGAGKSTLLKSIAGLLSYQRGSIKLDQCEVKDLSRKILSQKVSYVPQRLNLVYAVSVKDFILMGRYPYHAPWQGYSKQDRVRVDEMIERLCLGDLSHRLVSELSGGEEQRVLLAASLVQGASFVLLDEPTSYLDPVQQEVLYESLEEVRKKEGIGILIASHHLRLSLRYSERIMALAERRVVYDGDVSGFENPSVQHACYGKEVLL